MERVLLTVYSRAWCHLCHDMLEALEAMRADLGFDIALVDVDSDPALEERFGELVPLLAHGERELARYRLEPSIVRDYLSGIR